MDDDRNKRIGRIAWADLTVTEAREVMSENWT